MNFHIESFTKDNFFIYDTFTSSISSQHAVGITLHCNMFNKKFQNENYDEHDENETIGEKLSEKYDKNKNIIFRGIQ